MLIVAVSPNIHDSSVAIADEHAVLAVVEAERLTRTKQQWCNGPALERLVERGLSSIGREVDDVTHWCGAALGNVLLPRKDRTCRWTQKHNMTILGRNVTFTAVNHHLAHAASFFASPFDSAVIDACDAGGDGRHHVVFHGKKGRPGSSIAELPVDDLELFSGVYYETCPYYLYRQICQEGKFMGLAAHGQADESASAWLREHASDLSTQPLEVSYAQLDSFFAIDSFKATSPQCRDFARNAQLVFEDERVRQIASIAHFDKNIVLTGGSALNIHANVKIAEKLPDHSVWIPPCCDDTGQALGALLYLAYVELGVAPAVSLPFLGLAECHTANNFNESAASRVVEDLLAGKVIAWHWGRAEIGPRALGHRSLLGLPLTVEDRIRISERVKGRESYRPVAPVILERERPKWFSGDWQSPFMLFAADALPITRERAPAIVHVDGSARIQTIGEDHILAGVLDLVEQATGVPMLINTSLNGPGEPIVQTHAETLAFCAGRPDVVPYLDGERTML